MLKFFQRIRRKLLDEGNLKRYFIYSIGEILLVVVGILIALQVNNLNENRKLRKKEISIYKEIQSEIKITNQEIIYDIEGLERNLKSVTTVRNILVMKTNNLDTLKEHLPQLYNQKSFVPKTSAFESLKSIGLNIISNDSIRSAITNLYQVDFPFFLISSAQLEHLKFPDKFVPLLEKHLKIDTAMIKSDIAKNRLMVWRRYFPYEIKDLQAFLKDESLIVAVQGSLDWRSARIRQYRTLLNKIESLDEMISEELVRLE